MNESLLAMEESSKQPASSTVQDNVIKQEGVRLCGVDKDAGSIICAGSKADPASGVKVESTVVRCEAMDTNNNNNLGAVEKRLYANPEAKSSLNPAKRQTSASMSGPQTSDGHAIPMRNARSAAVCKANDPFLSHSAGRQGELGGQRSSSGRVRSFGPSPHGHGLISPDFPSLSGTPNSVSQLFNLPSSAFSLDGFEFPSPLGSGQLSPLTSARLGRKRALSISPLSSSSLDLNNLIRTSPTSLVNYITNSRGSSAGSMGHLSPSLLANPALFQPPYNRPLLTFRNAAHPQLNAAAVHGRKSESVANDTESAQIKQDIKEEPAHNEASCCKMQATVVVKQELKLECETQGVSTQKGPHIGTLETVQEEGGSSDDEGMQTDPTDYSSAITENDSELDAKYGQRGKPKRIYYSYPSIEEPHNNRCRWVDCDRQCETLEDLVRHVNSDHIYRDSRKEFVCCWTGCVREKKPFKAQYMLLVHMRRHTGEKPHKCSYEDCSKAYSRLENLKTHLRSHTGERPYICKVEGCGKAFSNASDCAKHVNRTHSSEKPYTCPNPGCTKRYTDPSSRRKHMKNCQVNKKACTDDRDAMSGADEESSAETSSIKSSSSSKKPNKPRKSEKRKQPQSFKNTPFGRKVHSGSAVDHGYISGGSQGYVSSHTGYNSSGYDTEYPSLQGDEEITRILQQQSVSDQPDISPVGYPVASGQYHHPTLPSNHSMDSKAPNVKASRQKGRGLAMPAGQNMPNPVPHPVYHAYPQYLQQSRQNQVLSSFQCCPSSQSGLSSFPQQELHYPHSTTQQHALPINNENSPPINTHSGTIPDYNGNILAANHRKLSGTASSGYSSVSFRSFSPPKPGTISRKSPSDDSSVVSSFRSSLHTTSYSTFSSNSSRVSSPCSNSGRSDTLRPHPPESPLQNHLVTPKPSTANRGDLNCPLRYSLRMNSYTSKQVPYQNGRRHSDELSESSSTRTWLYSSQSSRYSHTSSELSDEFLDSLPTDFRRDSFSKVQPLPLPESMQQQFSALSMGMEYTQENGDMGMELSLPNGSTDAATYNHPSQMAVSGSSDSHNSAQGTFPLHHFSANTGSSLSYPGDQSQLNADVGLYSQGLGDDGFDTLGTAFFSGIRVSTPNMVVGNMASFASTLTEETQYFENLLNSQIR